MLPLLSLVYLLHRHSFLKIRIPLAHFLLMRQLSCPTPAYPFPLNPLPLPMLPWRLRPQQSHLSRTLKRQTANLRQFLCGPTFTLALLVFFFDLPTSSPLTSVLQAERRAHHHKYAFGNANGQAKDTGMHLSSSEEIEMKGKKRARAEDFL